MTTAHYAIDPDTAELFAQIDQCLEEWRQSIQEGQDLAREILDYCAVIEEWSA